MYGGVGGGGANDQGGEVQDGSGEQCTYDSASSDRPCSSLVLLRKQIHGSGRRRAPVDEGKEGSGVVTIAQQQRGLVRCDGNEDALE